MDVGTVGCEVNGESAAHYCGTGLAIVLMFFVSSTTDCASRSITRVLSGAGSEPAVLHCMRVL